MTAIANDHLNARMLRVANINIKIGRHLYGSQDEAYVDEPIHRIQSLRVRVCGEIVRSQQ